MSESPPRICRVYSRMDMGGAENAILQLLQEIDSTHMVVTHLEGMRAPQAREAAERYTFLEGPRFAPLMAAMAEAQITHLHTINDHLLGPLAALLSGARHIIHTVHNDFQPLACSLVDHSIVVGKTLLSQISTPGRATFIPNGVGVPDALPEFRLWCEPGEERPLRIVELRRPDKLMSTTLDQIAASGALDGLDYEGVGIGFETPSSDPRIRNIGPLSDPYPELARADILVMGTTTETFGRTVYEAMAWGALPVATPIPAFREVFSDEEVDYFSGHNPKIEANPEGYRTRRVSNHRRVLECFDIRTMAGRTNALYDWLETQPPPPRSFSPDDLTGTSPEAFGFVMDELLSPGPFNCQAEFSSLPPKVRGIVLWAMVRSGVAREDQRTPLLARAYTLCGPRPVLCVDLGHALLRRRDRRKAEALFGQAAALDPSNMEAHLGRMDARTQMGDKEGARAVLEQALRDNPGVSYLQKLADSKSTS
jgi:hypothetical protein